MGCLDGSHTPYSLWGTTHRGGKSRFPWRDGSFYVRCDVLKARLKAVVEGRPCHPVPRFPLLPPLQGPWQLSARLSTPSLSPERWGLSSSSLPVPRSGQSDTYLLRVDSMMALADAADQGIRDDC